ncbi:Alpha/Beta hydrolase protein [Ilyonectria robusta]|uniref:Alpha/Beta hydrolase protein n=1 Tax=Ilyonectria robusta TaxID=1079257 RepID=UPI001E8CD22E|nr:Alpha/Beta hydrolase protein [Ilyonectria robusta]KAH8734238.1 Alpha/Beta hydrolase protein [Ilyonectria robusta]
MASNVIETGNGTTLHYLQSGNSHGPLLICLHGLGGSTNTFTPLVSRLTQSYNIVLVDFPGFGKSPVPTQRPTIPGYVSDLHDVIASLQAVQAQDKSKKVIIFGHSLGTAIALHVASENPSLVAGLVLIGSARSASHIAAVRQRMLEMAANTRKMGTTWAAELAMKSNFPPMDKRQVDESLRKEVYDAVVASDPEGYALTCEMMVDESHKDPDYSKIKCPTLLIAGDLDVISPVQRSQDLIQLIGSDSCWLEIVKAGHQPILEEPEAVATAIEKLIGKIDI